MTLYPTGTSDYATGSDFAPPVLNLRRPSVTPGPTAAPNPGVKASEITPPAIPRPSEPVDSGEAAVPISVLRLPDLAALPKPLPKLTLSIWSILQWIGIGLGALLALWLIFGGHRAPVRPVEEAPAWTAPVKRSTGTVSETPAQPMTVAPEYPVAPSAAPSWSDPQFNSELNNQPAYEGMNSPAQPPIENPAPHYDPAPYNGQPLPYNEQTAPYNGQTAPYEGQPMPNGGQAAPAYGAPPEASNSPWPPAPTFNQHQPGNHDQPVSHGGYDSARRPQPPQQPQQPQATYQPQAQVRTAQREQLRRDPPPGAAMPSEAAPLGIEVSVPQ